MINQDAMYQKIMIERFGIFRHPEDGVKNSCREEGLNRKPCIKPNNKTLTVWGRVMRRSYRKIPIFRLPRINGLYFPKISVFSYMRSPL